MGEGKREPHLQGGDGTPVDGLKLMSFFHISLSGLQHSSSAEELVHFTMELLTNPRFSEAAAAVLVGAGGTAGTAAALYQYIEPVGAWHCV